MNRFLARYLASDHLDLSPSAFPPLFFDYLAVPRFLRSAVENGGNSRGPWAAQTGGDPGHRRCRLPSDI